MLSGVRGDPEQVGLESLAEAGDRLCSPGHVSSGTIVATRQRRVVTWLCDLCSLSGIEVPAGGPR